MMMILPIDGWDLPGTGLGAGGAAEWLR